MERMIILTEKDYQELIDKYAALEEENKKLRGEVKELVERNIEQEKKYKIVLDRLSITELALQQAIDGSILI